MPVYEAPNHPDCWIECPGPGKAVYVRPDGPCHTRCGPQDTANQIHQIFFTHGENVKFDIRLRLDALTLRIMLENFKDVVFLNERITALRNQMIAKVAAGQLSENYSNDLSLGACGFEMLFVEVNASFGQSFEA